MMLEHVLDYYHHQLAKADYPTVYGAVPNELHRIRHIGDFYFDRCNHYLELRFDWQAVSIS